MIRYNFKKGLTVVNQIIDRNREICYNSLSFKGGVFVHIKELSIAEFDSFAKNFMISSYYQSSSYAIFMTERGYDYELIGYVDELGVIKAAALITPSSST